MPPGNARPLTRRQLLALSITGVASMGAVHARQAGDARQSTMRPTHAWGVQLYTVRTQIDAAPAATLKQIAGIGYADLEVLQPTLAAVAPVAASLGLALTSVHLDAPTAKGEGFEAFLSTARQLGLRYVVVPFVPTAERPVDRAGFDALTARLSRMARQASAAGLQLCYHNHAFEFGQDGDGTRWLDRIMRGTADAGMQLELDVFWAAFAGADPVTILRQYRTRVPLMHLKDKDPRTAASLVEATATRSSFMEVGAGGLDFPAILAAAREAGVRHYFVEQDATPGDPMDSLRQSYEYLARLPQA
jgi:sugar phosphate isomerase/epimerase